MKLNPDEKKTTSERPISLAGIDFKKLMSAFLKVKPEDEGEKKEVEEKEQESDSR